MRGGKREGAGRPKGSTKPTTKRIKVQICFTEEEYAMLVEKVKTQKFALSRFAKELVMQNLDRGLV